MILVLLQGADARGPHGRRMLEDEWKGKVHQVKVLTYILMAIVPFGGNQLIFPKLFPKVPSRSFQMVRRAAGRLEMDKNSQGFWRVP